MNAAEEIKSKIRKWLAQFHHESDIESIRDDLALIENKVISSIQIMDLILFIEHLRGTELKAEEIQAKSFHSINSIYEHFFCKMPQVVEG